MKIIRFIARSPVEALAQIHAQLGPEAVVLSVRPLPAHGVARLLPGQRRIEVMAGVPDKTSSPQTGPIGFDHDSPAALFREDSDPAAVPGSAPVKGHWRSVSWLETMGLLPEHAARLQTHLAAIHGEKAPPESESEWRAVSGALSHFWVPPPALENGAGSRPHVFIGPPGSGKTTVLCKWLTLAVLTEERSARVWRLDGNTANTAEVLGIHCEMLGVPLERFWSTPAEQQELWFIDLPGVEGGDAQAMTALRAQLASLPSPRVHLVLNAAYETATLLAQWRAFAVLEPEDCIFTHLDEETRRVKLWNFVFGTNCSLRFLSAGQKIPGEFQPAMPGLLFPAKNRQ